MQVPIGTDSMSSNEDVSSLMAYFEAVTKGKKLNYSPNDGRPLAKDLTYVQFCKSFTFSARHKIEIKQLNSNSCRLLIFSCPHCAAQNRDK